MRFLLDPQQGAFADSLDAMLTAADTPSVVRDWSRGDHGAGRALWSRIAKVGVFALAVPEAYEGMGPRPVELALGFVELGRHAAPGPLVETVAAGGGRGGGGGAGGARAGGPRAGARAGGRGGARP
ncbi:acyl-CoA dehydrogenase family protein, partial [Streptomyces sp. NPDC127044]